MEETTLRGKSTTPAGVVIAGLWHLWLALLLYTTLVQLSRFVETMRLNLVVKRDISLIVVSTGYIYLD